MAGTARLEVRRCEVADDATGARLEAVCVSAGADLVVAIGGGERPHVGAAALALSLPSLKDPSRLTNSSSLLAVPGHKEEDLARDGALRLSRALRRTVVVTVGIHDDAIAPERIAAYVALLPRLVDAIAEEQRRAEAGSGAGGGGH